MTKLSTPNDEYTVRYATGVEWVADSVTLTGAMREATRHCCHGYTRVYIFEGNSEDPIRVKYESDNKWIEPGR